MSLLSGIRFVPRDERQVQSQGATKPKLDSRPETARVAIANDGRGEGRERQHEAKEPKQKHKSERKEGKDKKHRHKHKRKRHRHEKTSLGDEANYSSKDSSSSSSSEEDNRDTRRAGGDLGHNRRGSSDGADRDAWTSKEEHGVADGDGIRSRFARAKPPLESVRWGDSSWRNVPVADSEGSDLDLEEGARQLHAQQQREQEQSRPVQPMRPTPAAGATLPAPSQSTEMAAPPQTTNQSAADLLRARLRTPSSSSLSATPAVREVANSVEVQRQALLLRNSRDRPPTAPETLSIQALMTREKFSRDEDLDAVYARNVLRLGGRFQGKEVAGGDRAGRDEDAPVDVQLYERRTGDDPLLALRRQAEAAVRDRQHVQRAMEHCAWCPSSGSYRRWGELSRGQHTLLRLKAAPYALHRLHCEIVPLDHVSSLLQCDEEVRVEVQRYLDCLARCFESRGMQTVAFQTAVRLARRPHAVVDVLPVEQGVEVDVHMFFREAFLACDEEWAQHKKVIALTAQRPLARAVPPHFPYLAVEWRRVGSDAWEGLAHPVEQDESIATTFCFDVMAGLLEEDHYKLRRNMPVERKDEERRCQEALEAWRPCDWTQYLDETA